MKKKPGYGSKMARAMLALLAIGAIALVAQMAGPTWAPAYTDGLATKLNDLQVDDLKLNGGDIVDSAETTRLTVGANNAFVGYVTATVGFKPPIVDITASTPTVTGLYVQTAAFVLYVSTNATGVNGWQKVGGQ